MKTLHQIFNEVKEHLLTQNEQALSNDHKCQYLTDDGLKCAIGCLIQPYAYNSIMEGAGANPTLLDCACNNTNNNKSDYCNRNIALYNALQLSGLPTHKQAFRLYDALQQVHDLTDPELWEETLDKVYNQYLL